MKKMIAKFIVSLPIVFGAFILLSFYGMLLHKAIYGHGPGQGLAVTLLMIYAGVPILCALFAWAEDTLGGS